jgi:hypothetical protein
VPVGEGSAGGPEYAKGWRLIASGSYLRGDVDRFPLLIPKQQEMAGVYRLFGWQRYEFSRFPYSMSGECALGGFV